MPPLRPCCLPGVEWSPHLRALLPPALSRQAPGAHKVAAGKRRGLTDPMPLTPACLYAPASGPKMLNRSSPSKWHGLRSMEEQCRQRALATCALKTNQGFQRPCSHPTTHPHTHAHLVRVIAGADQVAAAAARQVAWPHGCGEAVPAAVRRHDCVGGHEEHVPRAVAHHLHHPAPPGGPGLP